MTSWQNDPSSSKFDLGQYSLYLSPQGVLEIPKLVDPKDPAKNFIWTTDPKVELPILLTKEGAGAIPPQTCMEMWKDTLIAHGDKPALSDKVNGKWQTINYKEYYELCIRFALGLIRLGVTERSAVSILGYNCSLWMIDYFGAIFANCIACGHYLTNTPDAVKYVIDHSDTEVMVVENQDQLDKVLKVWDTCPRLK
jgi:long-chain-fatty-acid--CoA ligase ACSBG